ncbi:hypothetical protein FRC10_007898 [Ceratobasidium sp. 414]|nr:hypothetical protein FRC10_007898 [Ceratobasidium sp. 414]
MSKTANWPKTASNANALGRKHSLPVQFGNMTSGEADAFYVDDPGVATLKVIDWRCSVCVELRCECADGRQQPRQETGQIAEWCEWVAPITCPTLNVNIHLSGFNESKLASAVRSSPARNTAMPITDARQPRGRPPPSATLPALIDTRSYRDAAVKCTPPPSPLMTPSSSLPPTAPNMTAWLPPPAVAQRPKLDTHTSSFPPLSPGPGSSKPSTSTGAPRSYAKCFEPASTPVLESPAPSAPSPSAAKVITLNITPPKHAVNAASAPRRTPASPTTPSKLPRKKSSAPAPTHILRLPERARSASVSSISSTPSYTSSAPTSIAPTPRPFWESEEWYAALVTFARGMSKKNRRAWEKILRSDPKDTSKMKWAEFDSALKALGFESKTRGGSDLEYSPSRFGENGQEFSLGDLKAKAHSFRQRYPGAVAALHEAWNLVDTRC